MDERTGRAWSGRFDASPDEALDAINRSIGFDIRLWRQDVAGSRAHAAMLERIGILTLAERDAILGGLDVVESELAAGTFEVLPTDEDIHMAVERRLTALVGDPGRKLHTGRSRNDQVATDVRLFVREACVDVRGRLALLVSRLSELALEHADAPLPAYTHLQRGMPTTLGHHLLAWAEMFLRDIERFGETGRRAGISPLGSGACVGSSLPLDREMTAGLLGFHAITRNSLDGVADRDAVVEFLANASLLMVHLSRIGEEFVLWSTQEFNFVRLSDSVTTGSSMMPNKKNPDGAELLRGKAGRVVGSLTGLLVTLKGLPLAYNKDMQEDKEPLFDTFDTVTVCLNMLQVMLAGATFNRERMADACSQYVNATDLCEALVRVGIPLREAHHRTGRLVALAISRGCEIEGLPLSDVQAIAPEADPAMLDGLRLAAILDIKRVLGGTAPERVRAEARAMPGRLERALDWASVG